MAFPQSLQDRSQKNAQILFWRSGFLFGGFFALALALALWLPHSLSLVRSQAEFPWGMLFLGLPLLVLVCGLAGRLAAPPSPTYRAIIIWLLAGGCAGWIVGRLPFQGLNIYAWLHFPALRGQDIYPLTDLARSRGNFLAFIGAGIGLPLAILERIVLEASWENTREQGGLSWTSVVLLMFSMPLALVLSSAANDQLYRPLQKPYLASGRLMERSLKERLTDRMDKEDIPKYLQGYLAAFSSRYAIHLVEYQLAPPQTAYVDVNFQTGLLLRCSYINGNVIFCQDHGEKLTGWMDGLIQFGYQGSRKELEHLQSSAEIQIKKEAVIWFQTNGQQLSGAYDIHPGNLAGDRTAINVKFDNGFNLTCLARDRAPVIIDRCWSGS